MRSRTALFFLVAMIFGIAAVFLARQWLQTQRQAPTVVSANNVSLAKVVVATKDLTLGDRITADNVKEVDWPAESVPVGAVTDKEKFLASEPVVARRFTANEPILTSKLAGPNARATLSAQISDDQRAVSVRVNDVVGVAGFILPGDRVDVMVTRQIGETGNNNVTDVLLQNIKVIGIDQNANEDASGATVVKAVTLEVGPEQAQKLFLGSKVGELSLALRNYLDVDAVPVRTVTVADLRSGDTAVGPDTKPVRRRVHTGVGGPSIVVTRGTSSSSYQVR